MKIILAQTAGFCFGVKRAVDMAFEHQGEKDTYTYGPIIHNEVVINALADKGIKPTEDIESQPIEHLIIRSHGVSPDIYIKGKEKGIEIVDATCPYVKKIHRYVEKYSKNGYGIIIAGNASHPEVQGINGWGNNACIILDHAEAIEDCILDQTKKYLVVAQTTYKKQAVDEILEGLKAKKIEFEFINTICNATKERQEEAMAIASKVDCMLVLGSSKSSNTMKLYEISRVHCKKSYCIDGAEHLTNDMLEHVESIGITAGASTPQSVIEAVISKINALQG